MRATARANASRNQQLRRILEDQRKRILDAVRLTIREEREEGAMEDAEVQDAAERSEADVQNDLGFALLQMQGETLQRINEALERLGSGDYGWCVDCGEAIPAQRLEALPFAARCKTCAEEHEAEDAALRHAHVGKRIFAAPRPERTLAGV